MKRMIARCLRGMIFGGFGLLAAGASGAEAVVLDEAWVGYTDGGEPQKSWSVSGVGDKLADGSVDSDSVKIQGGWAVIDKVCRQPGNINPSLNGEFDLKKQALESVSFTYQGAGTQVFFVLRQGESILTSLTLGKSWNTKGLQVNGPNGSVDVGHRFSVDEEVTVKLFNFNFEKKTFSLTWSSTTGKSGQKDGLAMSNPVATRVNGIGVNDCVPGTSAPSTVRIKGIRVVATDAPAALADVAKAESARKPVELTGALKDGKLSQPLSADLWRPDAQGKAVCKIESGKDGSVARIDFSGKPGEWLTLYGPAITLPERDKFARGRLFKLTCDAKLNGLDAVAGMVVQFRVKQGQEAGKTGYARSASPRFTWDGVLEIGYAANRKTWDRSKGAVLLPPEAKRAEIELRVACPPSGTGTLWLRNVEAEELYDVAHILTTDPVVPNNIFFADTGSVKAEFVHPQTLKQCRIEFLNEEDKPVGQTAGEAKAATLSATLPGKGYYTVRATAEYEDGAKLSTDTYVAVVGAPLDDAVRQKSRFGSCRVHGNTEIWKRSGSNWDWGCNQIDLDKYQRGADGKVTAPVNYQPIQNEVGLNKIRSIHHLPNWLYGGGAQGDGLYPPKDWAALEALMAEFARTNPELSWMTPFNEPNAHFRGNDDEFVRLHKTIYDGVKKGNPNMKVFGPCLYSLETKTVDKFDKLGLFDCCDGFNMHAYVNGTEPEGEFIRNLTHFVDLQRAKGKAQLPLYLTEFGWCSGSGDWQKVIPSLTKAQYCARSLCLVAAQPVDGIAYFCYQIVGLDANESYSLIRPNGLPTPAYAAYVNVAKWFGGTQRSDGRWFQFSPKLHLVLFRGAPNHLGAAWSTEGASTLKLPAAPVRKEDMFGRSLPVTPEAMLTVGPSPTYFELPGADGFQDMKLLTALNATPGETVKLPWEGMFAATELTLNAATAEISNQAEPGEYLVVGKVGDQLQGQPVKIIAPLTLQAVDILPEGEGMAVSVRLANALAKSAEVRLQMKLDSGETGEATATIAAHQDGTVRAPLPGFAYGKRLRGSVTVELLGGVPWRMERSFDQTILLCPQITDDVLGTADLRSVTAIDFTGWAPWPKGVPAADLSASVKTAAGKHGLHLQIEATDDIHRQNQQAVGMWQEDSVQVAFDVDADKEWQPNNVGNGYNGHRILEYGIALPTKGGTPMVWRFRADAPNFKVGAEDRIRAQVKREGGKTMYEIFFPWAILGLTDAPAAGSSLGFAVALNDRDEVGGRHVLRLFGGIVEGKSPENFGRLRIVKAEK